MLEFDALGEGLGTEARPNFLTVNARSLAADKLFTVAFS